MVSSNSRGGGPGVRGSGGMGRGEARREEKEREHKELKQPKSDINFLNLHILPISLCLISEFGKRKREQNISPD